MSEETVKTNVFMGHRSYRTLPGPLQHLHSFLLKPFCCRFVDVLVITVLLQDQTSTDGVMIDSGVLWYTEKVTGSSCGCKKGPNDHLSSWHRLMSCVWLLSNVWLCVIAKDVLFGLICSRGYVNFFYHVLLYKLYCHELKHLTC